MASADPVPANAMDDKSGTCVSEPQPVDDLRVLSIQSHVVHGYVGNKVACFALQLLGIDTDIVNSCMLSNHTGYKGGARGPKTTAEEFSSILEGLRSNGLLKEVTHMLTGYAANEDVLSCTVRALRMIKAAKAGGRSSRPLCFVCDPVLGDDGVLYVPESLIPFYREKVLPLAHVLTPNCFELSLLSGTPVATDEAAAFEACGVLHDAVRIPTIVVTGASFPGSPKKISILVSEIGGNRYAIDAERLDCRFTGSGDLTAALILAWREIFPCNPRAAYTRVMATVTAVLRRTLDDAVSAAPQPMSKLPELKLVRSVQDIVNPNLDLVRFRQVRSENLTS